MIYFITNYIILSAVILFAYRSRRFSSGRVSFAEYWRQTSILQVAGHKSVSEETSKRFAGIMNEASGVRVLFIVISQHLLTSWCVLPVLVYSLLKGGGEEK